jgi:hemolysin III
LDLKPQPFSFWRFASAIALQFAALLLVIRFAAPAFFARQAAAGPLVLVVTFLGAHLFTCFFEWFFHRYLLHSITIGWLQRLAHAHRNHHSLTAISLARDEAGPGRFVLNRYPIVEEDQHEDSMFPWHALLSFWAAFTPFIIVAQLLLPHAPVILAGYAAVSWAMLSYETLHAIEHLPYEWWARATEHPRFGGLWRRLYGFHHFHHANVGSNEAISGFFGLPVADFFFRTYHQPADLLLTGRVATAKDFQVHPPLPFVVVWDRWARKREAALRAKGAAAAPRPEGGDTTPA